jgi:hypothetical protein
MHCGGFARTRGRRLDRAVSLGFDPRLDLELETGVVRIIMAASADPQDHAGIAFISEREDRAHALRGLAYMLAAGSMTRLTSDTRQVRLLGRYGIVCKATRFVESSRMAGEAFGVRGLALGLEGRDGMAVGT